MKNISRSVHSTPINDSALSKKKSMGMMAVSIVLTTLVGSPAWSGPEDGRVVAGTATISTSGHRTDIDQLSQHVVIDWNSFSIAANEHVNFSQPDVQAIALNRVTGGTLSEIFGQLTANGIVLLINPNGVIFSETSRIDVGGLVATTANISNDNFMNGNFEFEAVPGAAASRIVNRGNITAAQGGLVALVAPGVENSGVISARLGKVALAAGETFTLDLYGDQLISFAGNAGQIGQLYGADGQPISLVDNSGRISADGGSVYLLASDAVGLIDSAVSMTGVVEANTVSRQGGEIVLTANGGIDVSGALTATGRDVGESGGAVDVFGDNITVSGIIDASGNAGGGAVRIGGDFHGAGPRTASTTTITDTATINADALVNGDGGTVVVWADGDTHYAGTISAIGGAASGDGGYVEVSGKARLVFAGTVDATATNGIGGTLLLDPTDVVVEQAGGNDLNGSSINAAAINSMLRSGMSVIIDADNTIAVRQSIDGRSFGNSTQGSGSGLTLQAGNSVLIIRPVITDDGAIVVTAGAGGIRIEGQGFLAIAAGASGAGAAPITLTADGDIDVTNLLSLGSISLSSATGAVQVNNGLFGLDLGNGALGIGSLDIEAAGTVSLAGARTTSGNIQIRGNGVSNSTNSLISSGATVIDAGTGAMNIAGGAAVIAAQGDVDLDADGALTLTGDVASGGDIAIGGVGNEVASASTGVLDAAGSMSIDASGTVTTGNLGAGATGAVTINAGDDISTRGIFGEGSGVGSVALTSTGGSVSLAGAQTSAGSGGDITLTGNGVSSTAASLIADNDVIIDGGDGGVMLDVPDTPNVDDAAVEAGGNVTIDSSGAVTSSGAIAAGGAIRIGQMAAQVASLDTDMNDLGAGSNITVYSEGDLTVGDVGGANDGAVAMTSTAGNITTGGIFGDGDGVGTVTLMAASTAVGEGAVSLQGAQANGSDGISITAGGDITSTVDSLIASATDGTVTLNSSGGGVSVATESATDAVIQAGGTIDIDAATDGAVMLQGDLASGGSILIGGEGTNEEVGAVTVDALTAAANVSIDSGDSVTTTGGIGAGAGSQVRIAAGGRVTTGGIFTDDNPDPNVNAPVAVGSVDISTTSGGISVAGAQANQTISLVSTDAGIIDGAAAIDVSTSSLIAGGNITLTAASGDVELSTAGTAIDARGAGSTVDIDATTGSVDITGAIASSGSVDIDAQDDITAGDVGGANDGTVAMTSTAGNITTGGIFGDGDGVGTVTLMAASTAVGEGAVSLQGAQANGSDGISITAGGDITSTVDSLIASATDGTVTLNSSGGGVSVATESATDAVIQAGGTIDIDAATDGAVMLQGDLASGGSILIGGEGTNEEVGAVTVDALTAAANVSIDSGDSVTTTGGIGAGAGSQVRIAAGGRVTTGGIFTDDNPDPNVNAPVAVGSVDISTTSGGISVAGAQANQTISLVSTDAGIIDGAAAIDVSTSSLIAGGNITLTAASGDVELSTAGTAIDARGAGSTVDIDATTGSVDITGAIASSGSVDIDAQDDITAGDVGGANDGTVAMTSTAGNITTGGIFGDGDGVGTVTLMAASTAVGEGAVSLQGAQANGSDGISITAGGDITSTVDSLIASATDGTVTLNSSGGGVSVATESATDAVIQAGGTIDIDAATDGAVMLQGDLASGGSILIGGEGTNEEVGAVTVDALTAAANVSIDSGDSVTTTGGIGAGAGSQVRIAAGGRVTTGGIFTDDNPDPNVNAPVAVGSVDISTTSGGISVAGAQANQTISLVSTDAGIIDGAAAIDVSTSSLIAGGNITLTAASGDVELSTAGTAIDARGAGSTVDIDATTGSVDITGAIASSGSVDIDAQDDITAGDVGGANDGTVAMTSTAGNITTGGIFGDGDGVGTVTLMAASTAVGEGAVSLQGAQANGSDGISITAGGDITSTVDSLIASATDGTVTLNSSGGGVSVQTESDSDAVIQAGGNIDIDAATDGAVMLQGDLASGGSILMGGEGDDEEVGTVTVDALTAAADVSIDSGDSVTVTGGIEAGGESDLTPEISAGSVRIDAAGGITVGFIRGSDSDNSDEGLGTGVKGVTLIADDSIISTNGIDAGTDGISIDAGTGIIWLHGALQADGETGNIILGNAGALTPDCEGTNSCPEIALNNNIFTNGGDVTFNGNVTVLRGFRRVPIWFERNSDGSFATDADDNLIPLTEGSGNADATGVADALGNIVSAYMLVELPPAESTGETALVPVATNSNLVSPVDYTESLEDAEFDGGTGCNFADAAVCRFLGFVIGGSLDTEIESRDRIINLSDLEYQPNCVQGEPCSYRLDAMAELFAFVENHHVFEDGSVVAGINYPAEAYRLSSPDCDIPCIRFLEPDPDIPDIGGDGDGVDSQEAVWLRIASLSDLFGEVNVMIDTTQDIENNSGGGNVTFAGSVLRDEPGYDRETDSFEPPFFPEDGELLDDINTLRTNDYVSSAYLNTALNLSTGTGETRFEGQGSNNQLGFSSDAVTGTSLTAAISQGRRSSGTPSTFGGTLFSELYLGTFDLRQIMSSGNIVFPESGTDYRVFLTDSALDPASSLINAEGDPVTFESYPVDIDFNFIGTNGNRSGPDGEPGTYGGSPVINVGPVNTGSGVGPETGSPGQGANTGSTSTGTGPTGGSPGSGANTGSPNSGDGVDLNSGVAGNGANAGMPTAGGGASPGDTIGGSGESGDLNPGRGEPLRRVASDGEDTPSNLTETQKEKEEAQTEDEDEQQEENCPKGPGNYADYGNVPAQNGTGGNVFQKCGEDVVAANN